MSELNGADVQEGSLDKDPLLTNTSSTNTSSTRTNVTSPPSPSGRQGPHRPAAFADTSRHGKMGELMGPILRRKKVVSMPLGLGGDFFFSPDVGRNTGKPRRHQLFTHAEEGGRQKQMSLGHYRERQVTPPTPHRQRQDSGNLISGVLRRKQVSLDLLGPNDFFGTPPEVPPELEAVDEDAFLTEQEAAVEEQRSKLIAPLRFAPRLVPKSGSHAVPDTTAAEEETTAALINEETSQAFIRYSRGNQEIKLQLLNLQKSLGPVQQQEACQTMLKISHDIKDEESLLKNLLVPETEPQTEDGSEKLSHDTEPDHRIIRMTQTDKIKTAICFVFMLALTVVVTAWDTHLDEHSHIFDPVGLACVTPCDGNLQTRDFFNRNDNQFESGQVIELTMHMDPNQLAHDAHAIVEVVGLESNATKFTTEFGPPDHHDRETFEERVVVNFDNPGEHHIIVVTSSDPTVELGFTLDAHVKAPLTEHSVVVAAVIMVVVYMLILVEVLHRTLVAVFGSMVALMFFFVMSHGETESIAQIMLHLEWSTLGLLFGMMLIVGELSHTGIFEWCAVRLLVSSRGSFNRLIMLLCSLTAIASAFLDNVTTMLLVAPVTIDMCNILNIDPRPYLIGEVILSNIGGTATLIVSLVLICWIYRFYLTSSKMPELDTKKLKETYPIYDEPRLMIAGTVTFFVILMFFLHPAHHKDTAWIALLGAFITISFTNPHDVQDALRNHVEWDTLLFFAGLFVLVEVCAAMGLLDEIGDLLAKYIAGQEEDKQQSVAITLLMWVSAVTSAFLDNIPYTATMIPVIQILADELPETLSLETLAWALSFGACLGGNGTLLGASANIVTAGISTTKGYPISFLNFFYPGMIAMTVTVAIANLYMLVVYVWM